MSSLPVATSHNGSDDVDIYRANQNRSRASLDQRELAGFAAGATRQSSRWNDCVLLLLLLAKKRRSILCTRSTACKHSVAAAAAVVIDTQIVWLRKLCVRCRIFFTRDIDSIEKEIKLIVQIDSDAHSVAAVKIGTKYQRTLNTNFGKSSPHK